MMLSLSAKATETDIELQMVNGSEGSTAQGILFANELAGFGEAIAGGNPAEIRRTREALVRVSSEEVMVDAAAVAANFQRMVRIADSMGIPIDEKNIVPGAEIRRELDLGRFSSAQNTPADHR